MNYETERLWCFQDATASILTTLCAIKLSEAIKEYGEEEHTPCTLHGFFEDAGNRWLLFGFLISYTQIVYFWYETALAVKFLEKAPLGFFICWNAAYIPAFFAPFTSASLVNNTAWSMLLYLGNIFALQLSSFLCSYWAYKHPENKMKDEGKFICLRTGSRSIGVLLAAIFVIIMMVSGYDHYQYCFFGFLFEFFTWVWFIRNSEVDQSDNAILFPKARLEFFSDGVIAISGTFLALGLEKISYEQHVSEVLDHNWEEYIMVCQLWWRLIWIWADNHKALWFSGTSKETELETVSSFILIAALVHSMNIALIPSGFEAYIYIKDTASSQALVSIFFASQVTLLCLYWSSAFGNRWTFKDMISVSIQRKLCFRKKDYPQFQQQVELTHHNLFPRKFRPRRRRQWPSKLWFPLEKSATEPLLQLDRNEEQNNGQPASNLKDYQSEPVFRLDRNEEKNIVQRPLHNSKIHQTKQKVGKSDSFNKSEKEFKRLVTRVDGLKLNSSEGKRELLLFYFQIWEIKFWGSVTVMLLYFVFSCTIFSETVGHYVGIWPLTIIDFLSLIIHMKVLPVKREKLNNRYGIETINYKFSGTQRQTDSSLLMDIEPMSALTEKELTVESNIEMESGDTLRQPSK